MGSAVYNVSNEFAVHFKLTQGSMSNDVLDLVKYGVSRFPKWYITDVNYISLTSWLPDEPEPQSETLKY